MSDETTNRWIQLRSEIAQLEEFLKQLGGSPDSHRILAKEIEARQRELEGIAPTVAGTTISSVTSWRDTVIGSNNTITNISTVLKSSPTI